MELLYVWVEEYGNIKRQGFNFSPNYDINYDTDTKELKCEKKEMQQPKLFGDNISNITAIVGKNGSGKSTLLDFMIYKHRGKGFFLIKDKTEEKATEKIIIKKGTSIDIVKYKGKQIKTTDEYLNLCYYSEMFNSEQDEENISGINVSFMNKFQEILNQYNGFSSRDKFKKDVKELADKFIDDTKNQNLSFSAGEKDTMKLIKEILVGDKYNLISMINLNTMKKQIKWISSLNSKDKELINEIRIPKKIKVWFNFLTFLESELKIFDTVNQMYRNLHKETFPEEKGFSLDYSPNCEGLDKNIQLKYLDFRLTGIFLYYYGFKEKKENLEEYETYTLNKFKLTKEIYDKYKEELDLLFSLKDTLTEWHFSENSSFKINIEGNYEKIEKLISWYDNLLEESQIKEIRNMIQIEWEYNLSSGEIAFLNLFSQISSKKPKISENSIFLFDEPDINLHPEWQRMFIEVLVKYINANFKESQIILTSHSPFVASDLPRENVIMLDTDKDGNCVVRDDKKDKDIKTFGANIFDLYSKAFFVESSFGEFAKGKIKNVVKDLTPNEKGEYSDLSKERIKEIEYVLNSIGEPLVKNKLKKMYDEYRESKIEDKNKKGLLEEFKKLSLEEQLAIYEKYRGDEK